MHQVHPSHEISHDRWSWINHDLALARFEARRGQHATAIQIVTNLDTSIRNGLAQLFIDRGPNRGVAPARNPAGPGIGMQRPPPEAPQLDHGPHRYRHAVQNS